MSAPGRGRTTSTDRLLHRMSERDVAVLRRISEHRFLTTNHVRRLEFRGHASIGAATRACTRALTRLAHLRLVYRLERQIGGVRGGSGAFVWGLDDAGDRVLRAALGAAAGARRRAYEPSWLFLAHTLAVAETRVSLHEAAADGRFELLEVRTEPSNWRSFLGPLAAAQTLKPDLEAVTATGDFEDHFFLEVDQGTESLPVLIAKCLVYEQYRASGKEQAASGVFPLVIWLIASGTRRSALKNALARHARIDQRLFAVIDPEDLVGLISGGDAAGNTAKPSRQS